MRKSPARWDLMPDTDNRFSSKDLLQGQVAILAQHSAPHDASLRTQSCKQQSSRIFVKVGRRQSLDIV